MSISLKISKTEIWELLKTIPDPEIPVVSIVDLAMVTDVEIINSTVNISITPTYSGCPATEIIEQDILTLLTKDGYTDVQISLKHSPAWTTDSLSSETKQRLKTYGITPPEKCSSNQSSEKRNITCAYCDSKDVKLTSEFGSTPCKALYFCNECIQPFEYFKCL